MTMPALGKAWAADQIAARLQSPVTLIAFGTGSPSATALGAEISGSRRVATPTSSGAVATYTGHLDVDDQIAASITEVGLFNTSGTMIASQSFAAVAKGINDPFNVIWNINF